MALNPWKCSADILTLVRHLQEKDHAPRLTNAKIGMVFDDSKPFIKNKINLGKVATFSPFNRLWQDDQHDFCLVVPSSLWVEVLNEEQRKAYLDLKLTQCSVEYEPETVEENGKTIKIVDDWGGSSTPTR
mgnify:CR=1 FL=1